MFSCAKYTRLRHIKGNTCTMERYTKHLLGIHREAYTEMCAYSVVFVLAALAVQLDALPLPLPTSCLLVSEELGYYIHVTDNGTLTATNEEPARFFPRYDADSTMRLEVESHPGSFMMVVGHNSTNSTHEGAEETVYTITSGVPSNNGCEKWTLKSGVRGSYLSHVTEEGECYATFEATGAFCASTLSDNSWVQWICQ